MEESYLAKVMEALRQQGGDTSDLEKIGEHLAHEIAPVEYGTFQKPVRLVKGISIGALIISLHMPPAAVGKKQRAIYKLLVPQKFDGLELDSERATSVDENSILVNIIHRQKMTPERLEAYKKTPGHDPRREYDENYFGSTRLGRGMIIEIVLFDETFNDNETPLKVGDWVQLNGLYPEKQFNLISIPQLKDGKQILVDGFPVYKPALNPASANGLQWNVHKAEMCAKDPLHDENSFQEYLPDVISGNALVNFGTTGDYGEHNMNSEDKAFHTEVQRTGKTPYGGKERLVLGQIPQHLRFYANRLVVISLQPVPPTPESMLGYQYVEFDKLHYEETMMGEKTDKSKSWKTLNFQTTAKVFDDGQMKLAKINANIRDDILNQMGIVRPSDFAEIAPYLLPHYHGCIYAEMSPSNSHRMVESLDESNPLIDGRRRWNFDFGVFLFALNIGIDVYSGIAKGGIEVNAACAKEAMVRRFRTSDFAKKCPAEVATLRKQNPLNDVPGEPIINLMESDKNPDKIKNKYRFFLCSNCDTTTSDFQKWEETIAQEVATSLDRPAEDIRSELVLEIYEGAGNFTGWPVKFSAKGFCFTVFAVKKKRCEEPFQYSWKALEPEEFARRYKELKEEKDRNEAKKKRQAAEIAALEGLPEDAFDEPESKRQQTDFL